jgi:Tfp pilus assembly protein PilV
MAFSELTLEEQLALLDPAQANRCARLRGTPNGKTDPFRNQRGMSLVESVVGLLVLTIVLLTCAQLLRAHVQHLVLSERARLADTQANNTMNSLASYNQSALPDCNPFAAKNATDAIVDGEAVALNSNACQSTYSCDQVAKVPQSTGTAYDYVTVAWNQSPPTGGTIVYYRAWRVTTLDGMRHLRRITLAIIPADLGKSPSDSVEPLALRSSDVVQRQ